MVARARTFKRLADGSATCVSTDGEMVDEIALAFYGAEPENVERIYGANPGLSKHGAKLPHGVTVRLPAPPVQVETRRGAVNLWD